MILICDENIISLLILDSLASFSKTLIDDVIFEVISPLDTLVGNSIKLSEHTRYTKTTNLIWKYLLYLWLLCTYVHVKWTYWTFNLLTNIKVIYIGDNITKLSRTKKTWQVLLRNQLSCQTLATIGFITETNSFKYFIVQ